MRRPLRLHQSALPEPPKLAKLRRIMDGQPTNPTAPAVNAARTLAGAAAGGALGFFVFGWLVSQGFYAPAIPGVLLGVGGGLLAIKRSMALAVTCGVLALALGIVTEWHSFPFIRNGSLGFFLSHLAELKPLTQIMIALGGFGGFWFVWRGRAASRRVPNQGSTP